MAIHRRIGVLLLLGMTLVAFGQAGPGARLRVALSAAHTEDDVRQTLDAFRATIRVMLDEQILARLA